MSNMVTAIRLFVVLTVITGILYPALITAVGHVAFPRQAKGSIITDGSRAIGSVLIAQSPRDAKFFMSRPSAGSYTTVPSSASNYALSSKALRDSMLLRSAQWNKSIGELPPDLIFSSGSGLDPHISPEAALFQVERIARVRGLSNQKIIELTTMIHRHTEKPQFGLFGNPRVNVLLLNAELGAIAATPAE
jgi:potassium-transporting ATPase KdpC subunit